MYNNRDSINFASDPVGRLFRKMFLPTLIGMLSMVVLNITDGAFVGHGVGSNALAALNIVGPILLIVSGLGLMMGIGSSVVASIHLSKGNAKAANINMTQGMLATIPINIIIALLLYFLQKPLCLLFGCSAELLPLACSYLKWMSFLVPFQIFCMVGIYFVRLDGSPRFAMMVNCGMALLNIVLNYVFIYVLRWGIEGAAIATFFCFILGDISVLGYLLFSTQTVHFYRLKMSATSLQLTLRNISYHVKIGASALLSEVAMAVIIVAGNYVFMHYLGADGVAAFSVACYCLPVVFMMGNAIVQSAQPIVSFAYDAGDDKRLTESVQISLTVALVSGITGMALMLSRPEDISGIFLSDSVEAFKLCVSGLPYFAPSVLFISINIVAIGIMRSTEKFIYSIVYTLLRGFILSVVCFIALPIVIGEVGVWLALPTAEAIVTVIIVCANKKNIAQTKSVEIRN